MSVPAATGAAGVPDENPLNDVGPAADNAAAIGTEPVPDPSDVPVVDKAAPAAADAVPDPPAQPTDAASGLDELRGMVNNLSETVAGLVEVVKGLTPSDDGPGKLPWTHRGGRY